MINYYVKKPVVIRACQWTGENGSEMSLFLKQIYLTISIDDKTLYIKTLEGLMMASVGDYIIEGVNGEYYPCKPDIFNKTYEMCDKEQQDER